MFSINQSSLAVSFLLIANLAQAESFSAKVIEVFDGDTVLISYQNNKIKVRLAEIDAPEKEQTFGQQAQQALRNLVLNQTVKFKTHEHDQYGRTLAELYLHQRNINHELVRNGFAWEYSYFHRNKKLIALQQQAQQQKRGLWSQRNPQPPWLWRKQNPYQPNTCGNKRYCSQMSNCDEAKYYLQQCKVKSLDSNHDGIPCETLCKPKNK